MKKSIQWEKVSYNSILRGNGFYISYNPSTNVGVLKTFNDIGNLLGIGERANVETALCVKNKKKITGTEFFILNGDFRKEYEKLLPKGVKACKAFFNSKKKKHASGWSD